MLVEMLKLYGTLEAPGSADNPVILGWAREVGLSGTYIHDLIPWCGLTMAVVAHRSGYAPPENPLWALNWLDFGHAVTHPMLGDVMVKSRKGGGHITLNCGEDDEAYHCLGGNQRDSVSIERIEHSAFKGFRRPNFKIGQPANVRVVRLSATGAPAGGSEA